jgi:hypothetical protein
MNSTVCEIYCVMPKCRSGARSRFASVELDG